MSEQKTKYGFVAAVLSAILCSGCALLGSTSELPHGFTCCNLHAEADWISDGNYAQRPMIPVGTPAQVTGYGRHRAYVDLGGKSMRLGHDYGREQESLEAWTAKIVTPTDPKIKITTYPRDIQTAISQGRVMLGMTKEQVIMSLGYPLTSETPSLDVPKWHYWWSSFGRYNIAWDGEGRVSEIIADAVTKSEVVFESKK